MRVLFTLLPARGSLQPLLPVARALDRAGHQVRFCSAPRMRSDVEARGFSFVPAGLDWHVSDPDYIDVLCRAAGGLAFPPLTGEARFAWVTAELFIGAASRSMVPGVRAAAQEWGADLVVRESLEFAGCVAAEALGLPHASVAAAADSALDRSGELAEPLAPLRAEAGLPADSGGRMPFRHLHLCFAPPGFDGPGARFPATARFFAHQSTPAPDDRLPEWVDDLPPDRPVVLATAGTVFHRTAGLQEAIVEALAGEPVTLLLASGFDQDPARLGPLPPNVRAAPTLPQVALLDRVDLFITHGGFNSVKEAMRAGVPMVVLPIAGDQPYCARRCQALGLAPSVEPANRGAAAIRAAVQEVLSNRRYRQRAEAMRREVVGLPGVDGAVRDLEALAASRASAPLSAP